jgi:hypothetical protein
MVLHTCERCLKTFNKKSNYTMHTEHRKKTCKNTHVLAALDWHQAEILAPDWHQNEKLAPDWHQKLIFPDTVEAIVVKETIKELYEEVKNDENKEICIPIVLELKTDTIIKECENNCEYCNKKFVKIYGLNRHLKKCNIKNNITEKLKIENEKLKNEQKIKDGEIEKLKNKKDPNNSTINITNNNNNNIINNIQINIVNYREEDLSKLDLKKILKYDDSFIEMVFRDIHCNSESPENQNILLPSLSRYDIYIKLNNEWLKRNKNEILKERYSTIRGYIMDLYTEESEKNKKKADQMYFHFLKQIKLVDPTTKIYKPHEEKKIIEGIANVLYNHKDNIKSIIKTSLIPKIK